MAAVEHILFSCSLPAVHTLFFATQISDGARTYSHKNPFMKKPEITLFLDWYCHVFSQTGDFNKTIGLV